PKFAIDEVAPAAGSQTHWNHGRDEVADVEERHAPAPRVPDPHHDHADQPAVKRHAAFPDTQNVERAGQILARLVNERIAESPARHHTDHAIKNDVFQVTHAKRAAPLADAAPAQQPHRGKAKQVHQAIPVNGNGAQLQGDGVDLWVVQHEVSEPSKAISPIITSGAALATASAE